jgi:hypothetical protein
MLESDEDRKGSMVSVSREKDVLVLGEELKRRPFCNGY